MGRAGELTDGWMGGRMDDCDILMILGAAAWKPLKSRARQNRTDDATN